MCAKESAKINFCRADWVSRVNVSNIITTYINDTNHPFYHSNQIIYIVKHVEIFKTPKRFNGSLPQYIYTPSESAACGLDLLEKGDEYLLSGSLTSHNIPTTGICGQILSDLSSRNAIIQEWKNVEDLQKVALQHNGYEPCITPKIKNNATTLPTIDPVPTLKPIQLTKTENINNTRN
uniref:NTR domain-containing protein n=1 Tax=Parastrongyloides trichosuri TaxID=131310 RepID=A0A0N4ZQR7_PARTI